MNFLLINSVLTGVATLVASGALGMWQILSAPDRPNYPTSGTFKRMVMFWFAGALLYRAAETLTAAFAPEPVFSTPGQAVAAALLAVLMTTFLVDHVRHWLPAHTHARIQHLLSIARCRPNKDLVAARTSAMTESTGEPCPSVNVVGPALVALSFDGVRVAGPNEGPEAFTG